MKALYILLFLYPFSVIAQADIVKNRVVKDSLLNRMNFYGSTFETVTLPVTVRASDRYIDSYQENKLKHCNYNLYIFKPKNASHFFLKKFTNTYGADTLITEYPLVELSSEFSSRMERLFKKASNIIPKRHSIHFIPSTQAGDNSNYLPPVDSWRIEIIQRPPLKQFRNIYSQSNSFTEPFIDNSFLFALRRKNALRFLRKSVREFTPCE